MVSPNPIVQARTGWQDALQNAVRNVAELLSLLELPAEKIPTADSVKADFPLLVPRGFIARMKQGDPEDPLLQQVLPQVAESHPSDGFSADPLAEHALAHAGLIQKYPGRALVITTAACPVHCRYCFRRSFPYADQVAARNDWEPVLTTLRDSPDIKELILSGGDPLSLANRRLAALVAEVQAIEHIETLRIHTRFPILLPERVDAGLIAILTETRLNTVVVVHCNHANEIDASVAAALGQLKHHTNALLNQSVLLRAVNDNVDALVQLSERLFACGVVPYYLHLLDPVAGAAHFDVKAGVGVKLIDAMSRQLPGYLVPKLVRDVPGELSKTAVN